MTIPQLRFPDFETEWKEQAVGHFIEDFLEKSLVQNEHTVLTSSRTGLMRQVDYYETSRISERNNIGYHIIPPNYLTYRSRSDDRSFFFNENLTGRVGIISHYYPVFKIIGGENHFFKELFVRYRSYIGKFSVGTSQTVLSHKVLKKIKLPIPSQKEQKKISEFLRVMDEKIGLLRAKHERLGFYKKGVMQQLFTQKIRFKTDDGTDFPDWENKKLGAVFERVMRKNQKNIDNVLTISGQLGLISQLEYFNKSVSAKDVTGYYLLEKGEFAYNKSYSKGYPMGAIKRLNRYEEGVVSTLYICFKALDEKTAPFYEHFFESGGLIRELQKIAQEGARNHGLLNLSVVEFFKDIEIPFPHPDEQQKMADFLSALDDKIDA
ncbi:MAG: restriction endonuclease subunit S, partial [Maricaulaceae bacterium]